MGERDTTPGRDTSGRSQSLIPTPVYASNTDNPYDPYGHRRRSPLQQPSWWEYCVAWLRYQCIQLRWDIERSLARLLHRRW